jgi:hypothetical protein
MHKSRLGALVIDCKTGDLEAATEFWSQALGYAARHSGDPGDENYVGLEAPPSELHMEVQKVEHESRVHIDMRPTTSRPRRRASRRSAPNGSRRSVPGWSWRRRPASASA